MARSRVLVDTSVLIDHLRKLHKDQTIFYRVSLSHDFAISAVTEFEFLVGASTQNRLSISHLLVRLPVLPFDSGCVQSAVEIRRFLRANNLLIEIPDIFIAATALVHDIPLLTLNRNHFARIPNLRLIDPP